jgi:serpin B
MECAWAGILPEQRKAAALIDQWPWHQDNPEETRMCGRLAIPLLFSPLMLAACAAENPVTFNVDEASLAPVVEGNNQFALDLYGRLAAQPGNLFFSPYSISTALAMTYTGAQGETAAQMRHVLKFPSEGEELHACFGALMQQLTKVKRKTAGYQINIANRLWGEERPYFKFREAFLEATRHFYGAELAKVSFSKDSSGACKAINDWVSEETQQKIRELLQPNDVDASTTLVLTNAIYFKGDWARRFKEEATKQEPFYLNAVDNAPVPMMHQTGEFGYTATDDLQVLQMPYQGDALSMVILLPAKRDGLAEFEKTLTADKLAQWLKTMYKREVQVYLPRFKLEARFSLPGVLTEMGMPDAFGLKADFKGMIEYTTDIIPEEVLFISDVIHKAYVDVNEEGTEAAAATAVTMVTVAVSVPEPPPVFRADHPFVFLIRDNKSGSILFLGRLTAPSQ